MTDPDLLLARGDGLPLEIALQQEYDDPARLDPAVDDDGTRAYRDVAFARLGGFRPLLLDLHVPASARPVPVVVYLHGGAFLWGTKEGPLFGIREALLGAGIAVAAAQYRLGGEKALPAAMHDTASAIRWLRHFAPALGLAPDRIGVMGESAGGQLATLAGMNTGDPAIDGIGGLVGPSSAVQAVVGWYPVTDTRLFGEPHEPWSVDAPDPSTWPAGVLAQGAEPTARDREFWTSPMAHVNADAAPMLLFHGDADGLSPAHSSTLAAALNAVGVEAEFVSVPGADHVFVGGDPAPVVARTAAFFSERLGATGR